MWNLPRSKPEMAVCEMGICFTPFGLWKLRWNIIWRSRRWCVQPVGTVHDSGEALLRHGECKGKWEANRQTTGDRRCGSFWIPSPLSRLQARTTQCVRIGEGLQHQPHDSLQVHQPSGGVKGTGSRKAPCLHSKDISIPTHL